jgi:hypothetical protein
MTLTLEQNLEKTLALLRELPQARPGTVDRDFQDTVRDLCEQVSALLLTLRDGGQLVPPPLM